MRSNINLMAESFSDQSGDVISPVTQSQPHSSVQGNIIGVGIDIALSKEVTEEEEEGSLSLIQGTIKLLDDYSSASEREKELLRIAKEALKELLELQRKGTTDC
nr:hypothetical protein [Tanacetum cinerariifolium]